VEHLTRAGAACSQLVARGLDVETTRYTLCAEPGLAGVMFVPNWTEQPEPGGVNWIRRNWPATTSASSRHPRFP